MHKLLTGALLALTLVACGQDPGAPPLHTTLNATGTYTGNVTTKSVSSGAALSVTSQDPNGVLSAQLSIQGLSSKGTFSGNVDSGILTVGNTTQGAIFTGSFTKTAYSGSYILFGSDAQTGTFTFTKTP